MTFVTLRDLTSEMAPSLAWIDRNQLVGVLLPEIPGQDDFMSLLNRLMPLAPIYIEVAHAEFQLEFSTAVFNEPNTAFQEIFRFGCEEVFVEVTSPTSRCIFWIPSEHKFYAIFGNKSHLQETFRSDIGNMRKTIEMFSREEFFNERTRAYIASAIERYFTVL